MVLRGDGRRIGCGTLDEGTGVSGHPLCLPWVLAKVSRGDEGVMRRARGPGSWTLTRHIFRTTLGDEGSHLMHRYCMTLFISTQQRNAPVGRRIFSEGNIPCASYNASSLYMSTAEQPLVRVILADGVVSCREFFSARGFSCEVFGQMLRRDSREAGLVPATGLQYLLIHIIHPPPRFFR